MSDFCLPPAPYLNLYMNVCDHTINNVKYVDSDEAFIWCHYQGETDAVSQSELMM